MTLMTAIGRAILLSGRALRAVPGALPDLPNAPEVPGTTTALTLQDFVTYNTGSINIVQRTAGSEDDTTMAGGYADVDVESTFAGDAPYIEARVVDSANQAIVVKDWTQLTGRVVSGSVVTGVLPRVPAGGPYLLQIRDKYNTALQSNGTTQWGVGVIMLLWGQSNMIGTLDTKDWANTVPGSTLSEWDYIRSSNVIISQFTTNGWEFPTSTGLAGRFPAMRMMAKALEAKHGKKIPVGLVVNAWNSTAVDSFIPGPSADATVRALFTNSGTGANACGFSSPKRVWCGDLEFVRGHQGEANQYDTPTAYGDKLRQFFDMILGYCSGKGRTAQTLSMRHVMLGVFTLGQQYVENTRRGVLEFEKTAIANGWTKSGLGWTTLECRGPDGNELHFDGVYKSYSLRRLIQSMLYEIDPTRAEIKADGPRLAGTATRSGDTITMPVVGGETLAPLNAGSPVTGFYGHTDKDWDDTKGTPVTISNVRVSGGNVLADVPPGTPAFFIKHHGGKLGTQESANTDVSNLLYRMATYPNFKSNAGANIFTGTDLHTGVPLFAMPTAIEVT